MNQTLTSIFETQGPQSLDIANKVFSKESIFEEFIDSSCFHEVTFINCSFTECELLGSRFNFCVFEGCTFKNTIIRKSELTDSKFKNCQFIECQLSPKTIFFRTLFKNCKFLSVDFSFAFLCECEFIEINLIQTKFKGTSFINPRTKNITFNELKFDKNEPMKIEITDSDSLPFLEKN